MGLSGKYSVDIIVKDGVVVYNRAELAAILKHFEGNVTVTVQQKKKAPSLPMYGYYFGVCVPIVKKCFFDTGTVLSNEATHEVLKNMFLSEPVLSSGNEVGWRSLHLNEVSRERVSVFIDEVKAWTYDTFGVSIPEPGEQIKLDLT